ncbi:hypothetical protein KM043_009676 [Ampulex compressa]|nr:hypothetical protein KM043_009676 [Ampulex compressa]
MVVTNLWALSAENCITPPFPFFKLTSGGGGCFEGTVHHVSLLPPTKETHEALLPRKNVTHRAEERDAKTAFAIEERQEFHDPFPVVTRLMGERSPVGFSKWRAGNFSYARFRGKNKTGCRKRNDSPRRLQFLSTPRHPIHNHQGHYWPDMVKADASKKPRPGRGDRGQN